MNRLFLVVVMLVGLEVSALPAAAQPIATFRWQLQPYCNIVSVAVTQSGGVFRLDGTDDQCGVPTQAAVAGVAFINVNGSVGLGFTIVGTPGGAPVHVDATVTLPALNGTWRDSNGNTGTFIATPGTGIGGSPRPPGATHELIVPAFSAATLGDVSLAVGGCLVFDTADSSSVVLGLPLPRGAVISEVTVKVSDTSNNAEVAVLLVRDDYPDGGPPGPAVASQLLESPNNAHSNLALTLIPGAVTPVSRTTSYHLLASAQIHAGDLSFCGATVQYTISPSAAPDGFEPPEQ